jgi:hypothetical protein
MLTASIYYRSQRCRLFWSLLALVAWLPIHTFGQEALPALDGPFFVPESTDKAPGNTDRSSPFGDEKLFESDTKNQPKAEPPVKDPSDATRAGSGSLNNLFSHQWVHTSANQSLKGSVVTLVGQDTLSVSSVRVSLTQNGKMVSTVQSDVDGEFVFENVSPGFYSIAVMSEVSGSHLPGSVEMRVIRPSSEDVRRILSEDTVPVQELTSDFESVRDPIAAKRIFAKSHRVMSTKDGKVVGHLSSLGKDPQLVDMSQMKAMLLKDGKVISRSDVTTDGAFEFEGVEAGCYGFAAAGNKGIAAVAFCLVKPDSYTQQTSTDGKRFVAAVQESNAASELNVELANTADVMSIKETTSEAKPDEEEVAAEELPPAQPMMPYGGSNMFGAGQVIPGAGAGGGGFGGLAELIGVGAVGWAIYESTKDDDDTIVSPIVP